MMTDTMKNLLKAAGLGAVLVLALQAFGQGAVQEVQTGDELFVTAVAQADAYEINSSQLALEHASSEEVRRFAELMVEHHTMTTEQLMELATQAGMAPVATVSPMHQLMIDYLAGLDGSEFDNAYVMQQFVVHQAAVTIFEIGARGTENEGVRAFASENLPVIQEHLQTVQELMQQLGITQ
ncbi:MAG: DUF4142 domain-containing protein [Deinococcota bacterium]|jgi:putative membrane protein|nr:DUF4142 domain-containing protein [Deinococcota bacterium]